MMEKTEGRKSRESSATVPLTKLFSTMRHSAGQLFSAMSHSAGQLFSAMPHSAGQKLHSAEQID
jgi:hypothetical protein